MKVLIAHKNRVFYELLSKSVFHKYREASFDHAQTSADLMKFVHSSYDTVLAGTEFYGFSAVDAFMDQNIISNKTVLLLDSKDDLHFIDFLGREISLFDCATETMDLLLQIISPSFQSIYMSDSIKAFLTSLDHTENETKYDEHPLLDYSIRMLLWYVHNHQTPEELAVKVGKSIREVESCRNDLHRNMGSKGVVGLLDFAYENDLL
jgi:hypothetical protein